MDESRDRPYEVGPTDLGDEEPAFGDDPGTPERSEIGDESSWSPETHRNGTGKGPLIAGAVVVALLGVGLWWFLGRGDGELEAPAATDPEPATEAPAGPTPEEAETTEAETAEELPPLPPLDESDQAADEALGRMTDDPDPLRNLIPENLVRRFVVAVVNVSEGVHPRKHLAVKQPEEPFTVDDEDESVVPAERSYRRYDRWVDAFVAVDPEAAASAFSRFEPLFAEAYRDLGYPSGQFIRSVEDAIAHLLATPIPAVPPELERRVRSYHYADPTLESLSPAQKQLLRTGPENVRRIHAQLRELAGALGIPASRLPSTRLYHGPGGD